MGDPLTQVNALATNEAPKREVSTGAKVLAWMADNGIFVLTAVLIAVAVIGVEGFASLQNIADVFHRAAPIGIVAVGMTFVVISGNYLDLSVVAQVATSAVILIAVSNEYGYVPAILAAMVAATVFGIVNGVAVGYFKANAVIVTLSTTYIGLGLLRFFSGGSIFFGPYESPLASFGAGKLGPVPYSALVLVAMTVLLGLLLSRTNFGFTVRSFGVNERATRLGDTDIKNFDFNAYEEKIVKLIVRKKTDPKNFEKFIDQLYLVNVADLKIVETYDFDGWYSKDESDIECENTLSMLNRYIKESEIDLDKGLLYRSIEEIYQQACEMV